MIKKTALSLWNNHSNSFQWCSYYTQNILTLSSLAWVRKLLRIIIIDDEPNFLETTKEIMSNYDREMEIETSSSPKEAIKWVIDHTPDCVISDYKMPEMNGIEFTRNLRKSTKIPVILYTNHSEDNIIKEAFDAGISDFVEKNSETVHYSLLLRRIKNAVDMHRMEKQLYESEIDETSDKQQIAP